MKDTMEIREVSKFHRRERVIVVSVVKKRYWRMECNEINNPKEYILDKNN
jgi:hypothetical protein